MCWVRECSQPCLQQDVASKYHALHIIYCVNRRGGMKGGRDEAPLGCGLREEDCCVCMGSTGLILRSRGDGIVVRVRYFTHHKLHFSGILFEQPRNRSFPCEVSQHQTVNKRVGVFVWVFCFDLQLLQGGWMCLCLCNCVWVCNSHVWGCEDAYHEFRLSA